jgi:hypothetical protein
MMVRRSPFFSRRKSELRAPIIFLHGAPAPEIPLVPEVANGEE